jgi:hypothetical protein
MSIPGRPSLQGRSIRARRLKMIKLTEAREIPTERHRAYRQREARSGSGTERENLAGDAKGKGASGSHREAESTDASRGADCPVLATKVL